MKFTVNVAELQRTLKAVQALSEISASRTSSHTVCQLIANPREKSLTLDFSLNGSFLSYDFSQVELGDIDEESQQEIRSSMDLSVLTELKLTDKKLTITLGKDEKNKSGTIHFSCGRQSGTVLVSNADLAKGLDFDRSSLDEVELEHHFKLKEFLSALSYHTYGEHNDLGAVKRFLRILSSDGRTIFMSQDNITSSLLIKETPLNKVDLDEYVVPGPLVELLSTFKSDTHDEFFLGVNHRYWYIVFGNLKVWLNIVPIVKTAFDVRNTIKQVEERPAFKMSIAPEAFSKALAEISPYLSSSTLVTKEDMPLLCFEIENEAVKLSVSTFKTRKVEVVLNEAVLSSSKDLELPKSEEIYLNIKFMQEFCDSLKSNLGKSTEEIKLMWWPYNVKGFPMMGKGVCLAAKDHYYLLARANYRKKLQSEV